MSYFKDRLNWLPDTKISLKRTDTNSVVKTNWCYEGSFGEIKIIPFNLNRELYLTEGKTTSAGTAWNVWEYTRFTPEYEKEHGTKSHMPKGNTPPPFIPVNVLDAFEKSIEIPTLILTEGYIKAIRGSLSGLFVVGLPSITIYKDSDTRVLFDDIYKIITECRVRNIILLYDHDALNIGKNLDETTKRPNQFISSALNIRNLIRAEHDINVYWARGLKADANGLDDICEKYGNVTLNLSNTKILTDIYFEKLNITRDDKKLMKHFCMNDVQEFYKLHTERIKDQEFTFYNSQYKFDGEKVRRIYKNVGIFRIGDDFFQILNKPDHKGNFKETIDFRKRQTILDDHGKDFIKSMPKYISFCNIPNNTDAYEQVIRGCFNVYSRCQYTQENKEFPTTDMLLNHIFGDQVATGKDYLKIMWQKPTHLLPILCLVSRERSTGKTTFIDWLNELWGENAVIVGNSDFADNFNSIYANKTLIMCDESRIDKESVLEKLKALSTQKKININFKFGQKHTVPFFGKIILLSNYEDNFINTDKDEVRFWVRKIPVVQNWDADFEDKLRREIPAFIYYLNNTEIDYSKKTRQWFDKVDLETEALRKIIDNSKSGLYKNLTVFINQFFLDKEIKNFYATPLDIKLKWFNHEKDISAYYITRVLKAEFNLLPVEKTKRYLKFDEVNSITTDAIGCPYLFERENFVFSELEKSIDTPF